MHTNASLVQSLSERTNWSTVQLGVAIICAGLPAHRPLIPKLFGLSITVKTWYFSFYRLTRSHTSASRQDGSLELGAGYSDIELGEGKGCTKGGQASTCHIND